MDERVGSSHGFDELLKASEGSFRSIFENSTAGIAVVDLSGRYLVVNPAYSAILGYSADEFLELDFFQLTHPDDVDLSRRAMQAVLAGGGHRVDFAKRYLHKDGRTVWTEVSSALVYRADGQPSHFVTSLVDVTERTLAEAALREERERLAVTLRCIGDGVITTDLDGRVVSVNEVAERLTGWSQDEAAGRPLASVFRIVHEITRAPCRNPVDAVLARGEAVEIDSHTLLVARDGTERVIADLASPIRDEHGLTRGVVLVFRDMTEKQRLLEAAERSQRLDSLGLLAGGIAHDFNNLLAGIYGNLELLRLASSPDEIAETLQATLATLDRARGLAHQLLTFSKGGTPVVRTGSLRPFLEDTVRFALSGSATAVTYLFSDDLWPCEFDPAQLAQAIDNIVINAAQAMPRGGSLTVSGRNRAVSSGEFMGLPAGSYVEIALADTGVGMSAEVRSRIFDPFFSTKHMGNGLGLAVAHSIVDQHGGAIEVDSEPGKGSTFRILLRASPDKHVATSPPSPRAVRGGGRILVMDDERALRSLFGALIAKLGYEAVCTEDGETALRVLREETAGGRPFGAAIVDLTVQGGKGGLDVVAEMRAIDPSVPVLVTSGYAGGPIMADPASYGFAGSLAKPFTLDELSSVLRAAIAARS